MFGMFQKKGIGFKQIQRKKRLDRTLQIVILGSLATGFAMLVKRMTGVLAKVTGKSETLIIAFITVMTITVSNIHEKISTKSAANS
jgi:hypothetical protein